MTRRLGLSAVVLALLLLAAAMLAGRSIAAPSVAAPSVAGATVRLPIVSGRPAAGFFTLTGGARADRLVAVSSPLAQRIELHSMTDIGGVMRMRAEPGFDLPARGTLRFAPGGNHLMLFGLKPEAKAGTRLALRLTFASGRTLDAQAAVVSAQPAAASMPAKADTHAGH